MNQIRFGMLLMVAASASCSAAASQNFDQETQNVLAKHYKQYKDDEYYSGISLSIALPKQTIKNYYIGTISHEINSEAISEQTLFQIGSITKSFTAAIVLQLVREGKLTLTTKVGDWLPQYKKWSAVSVKTMLNMTSGLPNYSDTPLWNAKEAKNPEHIWSSKELIDFVYPQGAYTPPMKPGYFYTNTGYVLTDLIIARVTGHSFKDELMNRTIKRAGLHNTFYPVPSLDPALQKRLAHGYSYNQYDNPSLLGKDLENNNLSWAAAAGGIIASSEDILRWVNALFITNEILTDVEKTQLTSLISVSSGKPINQLTRDDSRGFGLGVAQSYDEKLMGHYWFYEGQTLGFRALYVYLPCNQVAIATIFNSSTNAENDKAGLLVEKVYRLLLAQHPELQCNNTNV